MVATQCARCRKLFTGPGRYCSACRQIRQESTRPGNKQRDPFYGTARWRTFRNWYIKQQPLCEICKQRGRARAADTVDHITEIKDGGARLSAQNVQSLCRQCHGIKTSRASKARARWIGAGGRR